MCLQVVVSTKSPKSDKQYVWEGVTDSSSYVIKEETDPEKMLTRGTQITLVLRVSLVFSICRNEYLFITKISHLRHKKMETSYSVTMQPDDKFEFADPGRIQGLVKNYSQFVSFPIYTWQEKSRTVEVRPWWFFLANSLNMHLTSSLELLFLIPFRFLSLM